MSVKKIKQSRHPKEPKYEPPRCGCMTAYGMDHCVATYAEDGTTIFHGIPCMYCGDKVTITELEINICWRCNVAEIRASERDNWYVESIYEPGYGVMHQEITEYKTWEQEMDELLRVVTLQ